MKKEYDVIVVGAGPAGSMAAKFAAEGGVDVLMLEKDRDVGYPVRCGEAVSEPSIAEFIASDEKWIAAHINKFSINAPNGEEVLIKYPDDVFVLERRIFDYELAKMAANFGADILTRAYVNGLIIEGGKVCGVRYEYRGELHEKRAKVVIAADGVESRVGRWAGLVTHTDFRDMESCVQVTAGGIEINQNTLYFYFGLEVAPFGYLWVFPKGNNTANIGLGISGAFGKKKSALSYLNSFMQKKFPEAAILTQVAGGVPCTPTLKKISGDGILLVGDAARQINPLSGGGIASGMIGGKIAGSVAAQAIKSGRLQDIRIYDSLWNERLGKRHEIFDRIKSGMFHFTDDTFNQLAPVINKIPYEKRTLGKVITTALINQPSLLVDIAKVFVN